jgi:hypothetical protein
MPGHKAVLTCYYNGPHEGAVVPVGSQDPTVPAKVSEANKFQTSSQIQSHYLKQVSKVFIKMLSTRATVLLLSFLSAVGATRGDLLSNPTRHHKKTTSTLRRMGGNKNKPAKKTTRRNEHRRHLQTTPCLSDEEGRWELWVPFGCEDFSDYTGADAMDDLKEILEEEECPHDAATELELVFGAGVSSSFIIQQIKDKCEVDETGFNSDSSTFPMTLVDEENNSDVWLKAFFDGGTLWNDARQSVNEDDETVFVLEDHPGIEIEVLFEEIVERRVMAFPEEISNFDSCEVRAAMCCWTQDRQANDDNGNCEEPYDVNCVDADPADNTDICLVDMERAPESSRVVGGFAIFPDDSEGDTHCHGFAWSEDEDDISNKFKGNVLFFVSMYDHLYQRGYVKNVPGAPMCACVEQVSNITQSHNAVSTRPSNISNIILLTS